jgi:two-component system, response regulator YesN
LIIDDEPGVTAAIADTFGAAQVDVHCATELEEAEALFHNVAYDVIIIDLSLSTAGSEGFALLKSIGGLFRRPYTVVLTGHTDYQYERAARAGGAHLFLRKPISATEVYRIVCGCVSELA